MESAYTYTIRPKNPLKVLIEKHRGATLFLNNPIVWLKTEGGFSSWSLDDLLLQIKLLFLVYVITTLKEYSTPAEQEFLSHIFTDPPFDASIFDKWWEIERLEVLEDFSTVIGSISIEELELFDKTGSINVDSWLNQLSQARKSGELPSLSTHMEQ